MFRKLPVFLILIMSISTANAEGGYIGVAVGKTDINVGGYQNSDSASITAGYRFNRHLGLELSYIDLGDADVDINADADGDRLEFPWKIETDGFNLSAIGMIPANDKIEFFAKAGAFAWNVNNDQDSSQITDDGIDISLGIGFGIKLNNQFSLVLEYQYFRIDDSAVDYENDSRGSPYDDASNLSLGLRLNLL